MSATAAARPRQLLIISAKTAAALERATARLADDLDGIRNVASRTSPGRCKSAAGSLPIGEASPPGLLRKRAIRAASRTARRFRGASGGPRPVAFMFSGQGSQYPGMGEALYRGRLPIVKPLTTAPSICRTMIGHDIRDVLFGDGGERDQRNKANAAGIVRHRICPSLPVATVGRRPEGHDRSQHRRIRRRASRRRHGPRGCAGIVATRGRLMQACPPAAWRRSTCRRRNFRACCRRDRNRCGKRSRALYGFRPNRQARRLG